MGLFSFLKKNQRESTEQADQLALQTLPLVQKGDFMEEDKSLALQERQKVVGLESIYKFLQSDFETRGYSDALMNPDESYKADNLLLIRYDLQIIIHQVNTYHEDLLRELDFHILSRSRAGLIDLVEELKNRKEMVREHVNKVMDIKNDLDNEFGMAQRILLSYQRGFMKGLSAITQSNVLNKQF